MAAVEGKGKHRSIVQRRELLARQRQSGLSVAAFCRERSLSSESFYRWRRELAGTDAAPAGLAVRIPTKSITRSDACRSVIPVDADHRSERSDAGRGL